MNSYEILHYIHKVGHLISCKVMGYKKYEHNGFVSYHIEVKTDSMYRSIITMQDVEEDKLPLVGADIEAVIMNHVDDTLYLSIEPKEFEKIERFQNFYKCIEQISVGDIRIGIVVEVMRFGVFVDLGLPFEGLIDLGHISFNQGQPLPYDFERTIQKGDEIKCIISYFRFWNAQIGLGYLEHISNAK